MSISAADRARIKAHAQKLAAEAPELTQEQRDRLRALLRPGRTPAAPAA